MSGMSTDQWVDLALKSTIDGGSMKRKRAWCVWVFGYGKWKIYCRFNTKAYAKTKAERLDDGMYFEKALFLPEGKRPKKESRDAK